MAHSIDPNAVVQTVEISDHDLKFLTPFTMCVSGASMSGKTEFIVKLIRYRKTLFDVNFHRIIYCQPESLILRHNPVIETLKEICPSIELINGLPDLEKLQLTLDYRPILLVIDDLMEPFLKSEAMLNLLTMDVHHSNISTIFTVQSYYARSRFGKTPARNVTYRCLFFNRLDLTELRIISTQISHDSQFLRENFEFLRKTFPNEPPYLIIDGHVKSPLKEMFVRTHIFPDESNETRPIFFFPKSH
ncbi:MAG: hypothetical protein FJ333_10335 [Sphingomonadales bacterium]|nr:hypothetical protein [Sphingomonadales bacterium]